jgi:hypothetical protein
VSEFKIEEFLKLRNDIVPEDEDEKKWGEFIVREFAIMPDGVLVYTLREAVRACAARFAVTTRVPEVEPSDEALKNAFRRTLELIIESVNGRIVWDEGKRRR